MLIQIFLVVLLDRITKFFITHTMTVGMSFPVIPGVVSCTYVLNPGAAFGLLEYQRVFFVVITLLAAPSSISGTTSTGRDPRPGWGRDCSWEAPWGT